MCSSESGSGWVIKHALFDRRSISDTPICVLQQQLSKSVWFHCVCVATLGSWPASQVYMYSQSSKQPLPQIPRRLQCKHPPHNLACCGLWSCPNSPPFPRGGGWRLLTRLWIGVCSPGWQTFTLPRQKFPTLYRKKKRKLTTLARISVACYLVTVEQQFEYRPTHNSKFRWHTCLVC